MGIVSSISKQDFEKIQRAVDCYPDTDLPLVVKKIFQENITTNHFIVLGLVIGERHAAINRRSKNSNYLHLCQRTN